MKLRSTLVAGLIALAVTVSACSGDQKFTGVVLDQPYRIDSTALIDTEGQAYSLTKDTDARLTLVFFGYTHCPDLCATVMSSLASALTRLDDADRKQVQVVFVTTDPGRDDEQTLRRYLDHYDPDFLGLTGPLADIVTVGDSVHVPVEKGAKLPSGGYEVVHGTSVIAIDNRDEVPVVWTDGTSAAQYAADIHSLLGRPR